MAKLLAFNDFQQALLFKFAVRVGADFDRPLAANDAAELVEGRFQKSWISVAASQLHDRELLQPTSNFDEVDSEQTFYKLTPIGLSEALQYGRYNNTDLWSEIEKLEDEADAEISSPDFDIQGPVIEVDRSSQIFLDLEREIKDTLRHAQMSNQLPSNPVSQRRIKEIEAGQKLLEADQIDVGLIRRILLPALRSLLKIATEETIKAIIKKAIDALLAFLP